MNSFGYWTHYTNSAMDWIVEYKSSQILLDWIIDHYPINSNSLYSILFSLQPIPSFKCLFIRWHCIQRRLLCTPIRHRYGPRAYPSFVRAWNLCSSLFRVTTRRNLASNVSILITTVVVGLAYTIIRPYAEVGRYPSLYVIVEEFDNCDHQITQRLSRIHVWCSIRCTLRNSFW